MIAAGALHPWADITFDDLSPYRRQHHEELGTDALIIYRDNEPRPRSIKLDLDALAFGPGIGILTQAQIETQGPFALKDYRSEEYLQYILSQQAQAVVKEPVNPSIYNFKPDGTTDPKWYGITEEIFWSTWVRGGYPENVSVPLAHGRVMDPKSYFPMCDIRLSGITYQDRTYYFGEYYQRNSGVWTSNPSERTGFARRRSIRRSPVNKKAN